MSFCLERWTQYILDMQKIQHRLLYNWSCHLHFLGSDSSYLNLLLKETLWDYNSGGSSTLRTFLFHCPESLPFEKRNEQRLSVVRFPLSIFVQSKCLLWNCDSQSIIRHCIKNLGRKTRYNIYTPWARSLGKDQSRSILHFCSTYPADFNK